MIDGAIAHHFAVGCIAVGDVIELDDGRRVTVREIRLLAVGRVRMPAIAALCRDENGHEELLQVSDDGDGALREYDDVHEEAPEVTIEAEAEAAPAPEPAA